MVNNRNFGQKSKLWLKIQISIKVQIFNSEIRNRITHSTGGNLLISDLRVTYARAQSTCEQMGTFLVTIESEEKMKQVQAHVEKLKRWDIWIGLNRLNEHDEYRWDNQAPVSYTNWDDGKFLIFFFNFIFFSKLFSPPGRISKFFVFQNICSKSKFKSKIEI